MAFEGAIAERHGNVFSVFLVHHSLLSDVEVSKSVLERLSARFFHLPVGLLANHPSGRTVMFAEPSLADHLANVVPEAIEWLGLEGP